MCDRCEELAERDRNRGQSPRDRYPEHIEPRRTVVELVFPTELVSQLTHRLGTIERQGAESLRMIRIQGEQLMSLRDDFNAAEDRVEAEIKAVADLITSLPSSVDELTQEDLDRVKAQGDSLAAVLPTTVEPTDPGTDPQV